MGWVVGNGKGIAARKDTEMEVIAEKVTVCPGCNGYITPGQDIVPYDGAWYHASCDFNPRFGASGGVSASVQRRAERNERIRKAARKYPAFSTRDIADHLGLSKSTVHRVLQEQAQASRQAAFRALASGQ